jgi:hypothetical protein
VDILAELDALVEIGAEGDHDAARAALADTLVRLQPAISVGAHA